MTLIIVRPNAGVLLKKSNVVYMDPVKIGIHASRVFVRPIIERIICRGNMIMVLMDVVRMLLNALQKVMDALLSIRNLNITLMVMTTRR